uniref:Cytochrome P450 n=1 Tax=Cricetulus griseus TaxID=10029 RepID=A0A8C2MRK0_CRIGR
MELLTRHGLWPVAMLTVIFILLWGLLHQRQRWTARYPPGPVSLPLLGSLLQEDLKNMPYIQLQQCYGDIFSLQMAWKHMVMINGQKAVWEVLVNYGDFEHGSLGPKAKGVILAPYGPEWRKQRRFSVSTLRNLGLGKKSLEQWVTDEAGHLCDAFTNQAGCPFNPSTMLDKAMCNVISSLIFAHHFKYEDPYLIRVLKLLEEEALRLPLRRTWDPEHSFNDENLHMVVNDLFAAETVSTSSTLSWALLLTILYPDVQSEPVQQEIDAIIGQRRSPEMADQAHMPFTNAAIHEVQHFGNVSPLNLLSITSRDIEVQGFLIPKGTTLIPNLSSVLKDETVWEKPLHFHPEHFLDAQGRFVKHEAFMPFSAGRRVCLGEPLARMELFLFFTCLLQRFSFSVPDGQPRPSTQSIFTLPATPVPYELCAVMR